MGFFTVDQLRKVHTVISHGRCPDGVASAMILRDAYAKHELFSGLKCHIPEIRFVVHSTREHFELEPKPGMMFVDFSPKPDRLAGFIEAGTLVLDHHKKGSTVQAFVEAGLGVFGDEDKDPGICGASLAYEHVWRPLRQNVSFMESAIVNEVARLSGIRDTWQDKDLDFDRACKMAEAMRWWPEEELLGLSVKAWPGRLELGPTLWDKKMKTIQKIAERVFWWRSAKGTRVAFFQGAKFSSDVTEALDAHPEPPDLVVAYELIFEDNVHKMVFSTRSHKGFDCGAFALAHKGGGHTAAAGFGLKFDPDTAPNPYKLMQDTLDAYEARPPEET